MNRNIKRLNATSRIDTTSQIVNTFKQRVLEDGGTFEADLYLKNWLAQNTELYNRSNFVLTPNGYKPGTLYAFKGQDYNTFSRLGTATRLNSSLVQEVIPINVPRIDYEHNTPTFLSEIQTTNLWHNTSTQTITVIVGRRYSLSFFGTGTVTVTGAFTATINGTANNIKTETAFANATASTTSVTLTVSGLVFAGNFNDASFSDITGGVQLFLNQPTSHIPTVTSNITRSADNFSALNVGTLVQGEFCIFLDYLTVNATFAGTNATILTLRSASNANALFLNHLKNGFAGTGFTAFATTDASTVRLGNNYGQRNRYAVYVNCNTNQWSSVSTVFNPTAGGWLVQRINPITTFAGTFLTDMNQIRLAEGNQGKMSVKFKNVSILKDFSGISNIPAFLTQLATRNSV